MSVINSQPLIGASGNQGGAYNLTRSLRFRSSASAYLNRTPASAGNRRTWTWSGWVKRGTVSSQSDLFAAYIGSGTTDNQYFLLYFDSAATLRTGGYSTGYLTSTAVYRDPSAWYHIVCAVDTTQATANNRIRLYVNGAEVTSFSTRNNPTQNAELGINQAAQHQIGQNGGFGSYFDGYLTEVNFIDGQALTPSDFGETDTATGVWKPKRYTGTYGTNGFYLPFSLNQTASHSASLNGSSQYLSFPNSSNFAFGTGAFTIEGWLNGTNAQADKFLVGGRSAIGTLHITTGGSATSTTAGCLRYVGSSTITSGNILVSTGTWTHWAVTRDGSNNVKLWINGQEVGSGTDTTNYSTTSGTWFVGVNDVNTAAGLLAGNVSNLRIVKGSAVYTAKFAPPSANLTAISGTSLLTLQSSTIVDNSGNSVSITNTGSIAMSVDYPFSSNVSYDASGNNNNWVANNISLTSGATYDSMKDVPTLTDADTANYGTWNPIGNGGGSISNGNLRSSTSSVTPDVGTFAMTSGKWYWEVTVTTASNPRVGVYDIGSSAPSNLGANANGWAIINSPSRIYFNGSTTNYGSFNGSNGDVVMVAYDADAGNLWFGANNSWFASGNPATAANPSATSVTGKSIVPAVASGTGSNVFDLNCGQRPFAYTPPSGFKALNTFNLPTPTIGATASTQANKYMDATTYTGTGSTLSVTNAGGFQPDLVWLKARSQAYVHILTDSVRGADKQLISNNTNAEATNANIFLTSFNSNGFTVGTDSVVNQNTNTYVGWQWNGGGSNATNTSGTITSTVRANTSAGFSIVTYAGTGSNATVGHGLGVAPSMVIVKCRNTGSTEWIVYHKNAASSAAETYYLTLDGTFAASNGVNFWNNTAPTSSVFSVSTQAKVNGSGNTFVAYCFTDVAGYSAFGRYTGNGSTDGPFVFLGFRPRWIMFKRTDSTDDWVLMDTARNTFNVISNELYANLSGAEGTGYSSIDYISNGFKLRSTGSRFNANGGTYVYAAFAETPFKYSLGR